ncbi:MAG TPA: histidine kinase dimerization/phospho-acceptor domain-containing protein, partial [Chloroflexota bacterium]
MMRALSRLRWQLTLSHLVAIAFTLITMIAAVIFIGSSWFARQTGPADEPAQIAQVVAGAVEGIVAGNLSGASPTASGDLDRVLSLLAKGELSVRFAPPFAPEQAQRNWWFGGPLHDISYIAVVRPDGTVLGSSDPSGAAFAPADRAAWAPLVAAALSRGGDTFRANAIRPAGVPATLGAYPVRDSSGRPMAVVLVESTVASPASTGFIDFWRVLAFFTTASILVLAGASIFALISASAVGYFLARRLVARLERLGRAAEEFASGDLGRRVEEGADDEVGRLARQFNRMAARLSSTVAQLEAERQHAEAALRAKRELVANVSHELRTPLASIRGHTESLLMRDAGSVDGARREYLNVIDREAKQLGRLIEDLFTLSTAEAGALPLSLGPTNIGEAIDEAVSGILPMARTERRVSLVTRVDPGLGAALADPQRVVQVLGNLLRNA